MTTTVVHGSIVAHRQLRWAQNPGNVVEACVYVSESITTSEISPSPLDELQVSSTQACMA